QEIAVIAGAFEGQEYLFHIRFTLKFTVCFFGTVTGSEKPVPDPAKTRKKSVTGEDTRLEMMQQFLPIVPDILFQQQAVMSQFFPFQLQLRGVLNSFHGFRFPMCFSSVRQE